jgi:hypothetical protein
MRLGFTQGANQFTLLHRCAYKIGQLLSKCLMLFLRPTTGEYQMFFQPCYWVTQRPARGLVRRPVFCRIIARGMALRAIRKQLDQCGTFVCARAFGGPLGDGADR